MAGMRRLPDVFNKYDNASLILSSSCISKRKLGSGNDFVCILYA